MLYQRYLVVLLCLSTPFALQAQKQITLKDCFTDFRFYPAAISDFTFLKNGQQYSVLENSAIRLRDIEKESFDNLLFQIPADIQAVGYTLSENAEVALLHTAKEPVYRHSFLAQYFVLTNQKGKAIPIGGKDAVLQKCLLSPDGTKVAYVRQNNLFMQDLATEKITQITRDGKPNAIINGIPDWLYEEEFSEAESDGFDALKWSPDAKRIAFLRFDETDVPEFTLTWYKNALYPEQTSFKYPKVGSMNAQVTAHIYDLASARTKEIATGPKTDCYVPRITWTPDNQVVAMRLNRHQDTLQVFICKPNFDQDVNILGSRVLITETDSAYVELAHCDYLTFLQNKEQFIWASERDGANHLYLYDMQGKLVRRLTEGKEEITAFYGVDEVNKKIYVQSSFLPVMRMVWEMPLEKGEVRNLSPEMEGWHEATFAPGFNHFVLKMQSNQMPPVYTLRKRDGSVVRTLLDNAEVAKARKEYGMGEKEYFQIPINKKLKMNCWMIKPPDYTDKKKYPVIIDIYGGPGSQTVKFEHDGYMEPWHQMMAQKGYLIVSIDNRGTGGRGRDYKKCTQLQLGKLETQDQIAAARHMGALPWVDKDRIGIWGWSYGGFLSTNAMLKSEGVYKMAIAVAPVTNWKWYDSGYTERFLHTYDENSKGFDENSPINYAEKLKGKYLLCHGTADDNVHWQHSVAMTDALIKAGKQFETYYYPNRNHGIYDDGATMHLFEKITDFILKNL
jgi:dipeptidyl-peptidase 4